MFFIAILCLQFILNADAQWGSDRGVKDEVSEEELDRFKFPDVSDHENIDLLPMDCGHLAFVKKIVNGNKTFLFEFPWMALLSYQTPQGQEFRCGGTIINQNYILTAAHCVTNLKRKIILRGVRVGEHDIRTKTDCQEEDGEEICAPPVQDLTIETVKFHENYSTKTHVNDIALLRVSPIDLNQVNSRPVCLPLRNLGNFNYTGRRVVVTGWGYTEKGLPSPDLLKTELPISSMKKCQDKYSKIFYRIIEKQLCAGGNRISDSCGGDSGGPLHSLGSLHGKPRYIQQGIVSFGPWDCGNDDRPGVYTRVASYMDWILDNMEP